MSLCSVLLFFFYFLVLTGWLKYPISQSVCGESLRSSSHSGDAASWLCQGQVIYLHECKNAVNLYTWPVRNYFWTPLPFAAIPFHHFPILSLRIIFCIASSETATSPWWLGSAAPGLRFVGWTVPRTNHSSACARPPRGLAQRWLVISRSALVIQPVPAVQHNFNRFFASFWQSWELGFSKLYWLD